MNKKQVLLLGASGLVGSHVLSELLASDLVGNVTVLVRNPLAISNSKLTQVVTDFSDWTALDDLTPVDVLFCCIGPPVKKLRIWFNIKPSTMASPWKSRVVRNNLDVNRFI